MLHITQLIYLKTGKEATFHAFEDIALPILSRYNGRLLLRLRPSRDCVIESAIEYPYEMHWVEFQTPQDFDAYMKDEQRNQSLFLKDQSVSHTRLFIAHMPDETQ